MGGIASGFGVAVSMAVGGVLSALLVGLGAFVWIRRHGLDRAARCAPVRSAAVAHAARAPWRRCPRALDRAEPPGRQLAGGPEDERGVEPAEPERGRQHAPVACRRGPRAAAPAAARPTPGRARSRLTDAGAQPSRIASAQMAASIAPDAPSGWPYSALVPLTGTVAARSPRASGDRPRLGHVADRRRRGVGVDVVDLGRLDAGVVEGDRRRPGRLACRRPVAGPCDGRRTWRRSRAAPRTGVAPRASATSAVLEHEQRRSLAHDEPVAPDVERPRGRAGRVVVAGRQRPDDVERPERERAQRDLARRRRSRRRPGPRAGRRAPRRAPPRPTRTSWRSRGSARGRPARSRGWPAPRRRTRPAPGSARPAGCPCRGSARAAPRRRRCRRAPTRGRSRSAAGAAPPRDARASARRRRARAAPRRARTG